MYLIEKISLLTPVYTTIKNLRPGDGFYYQNHLYMKLASHRSCMDELWKRQINALDLHNYASGSLPEDTEVQLIKGKLLIDNQGE